MYLQFLSFICQAGNTGGLDRRIQIIGQLYIGIKDFSIYSLEWHRQIADLDIVRLLRLLVKLPLNTIYKTKEIIEINAKYNCLTISGTIITKNQ